MLVKIGADSYELHANNVKWSKNTTQVEWQGGTRMPTMSTSSESTHACAINLVHDYQTRTRCSTFSSTTRARPRRSPTGPTLKRTSCRRRPTPCRPRHRREMRKAHESTVTCPSTKPTRTFTAPA